MEFSLAQIYDTLATTVPEREALVFRDRRLTWADLADRVNRLANLLSEAGLGLRRERSELAHWESGQDHVALLLHNGNAYLEGMLGAFRSRTVPVNVNYRFVESELLHILQDSEARALVFHARFAEVVERLAPKLPHLTLLLQVDDGSGGARVSGAVDYEAALAAAPATPSRSDWSPDDLYLTYTGGTTGMPRAVLWRQADILLANMNGRAEDGTPIETLEAFVDRARASSIRVLTAAPFMHVAGHAAALGMWCAGGTVVIPDTVDRFDPVSILESIERERVTFIVLVGDAMARPLIDTMRSTSFDLSSLQLIVSGGAALSARAKEELVAHLPHVMVVEGVGSSETGGQASNTSGRAIGVSRGAFSIGPGTALLDESRTGLLPSDDATGEIGWLARSGAIPLGYLGDPEKTRQTMIEVDGTRYVVPGDRARWRDGGELEFLGRESTTINTGGEKVFAEEVEAVLLAHPDVRDAAVAGRPDPRLGHQVVAVVALADGAYASELELVAWCAKELARFKLPRRILFRNEIERGATGKIDLPWLRRTVGEEE